MKRYLLLAILLLSSSSLYSLQAQVIGAKAYLLAGQHFLPLDSLDKRLEAQGYDEVDDAFNSIGGGAHVSFYRWIVGAEGHYLVGNDTATVSTESSIRAGYGVLNIGYMIHRSSTQQIYPLLGIGAGSLSYHVHQKSSSSSSFESHLETPNRGTTLTASGTLVQLSIAADHLWETGKSQIGRGGMTFGFRLGYSIASFTEWSTESGSISKAPNVGLSGPFLRFAIGFGGESFTPLPL